jgi:hypothetical protein
VPNFEQIQFLERPQTRKERCRGLATERSETLRDRRLYADTGEGVNFRKWKRRMVDGGAPTCSAIGSLLNCCSTLSQWEDASILLGHTSIRATEKSYAPEARGTYSKLLESRSGVRYTAATDARELLFYQFAVLVEAAGVEPASEKARRAKTTCVAGSVFSATA